MSVVIAPFFISSCREDTRDPMACESEFGTRGLPGFGYGAPLRLFADYGEEPTTAVDIPRISLGRMNMISLQWILTIVGYSRNCNNRYLSIYLCVI